MYDSYLAHHGVKGQRWGVRRYQNSDGTLTAAGKKRRRISDMSDDELSSEIKRMNLEKTYRNLSKQSGNTPKMEQTKRLLDASVNAIHQAKNINNSSSGTTKEKLDLSKMTDKELRDRINRANLERQYNDLFGKNVKTVSKGQAFLSDVLDIGGGALAIGSSAIGIALAIKELRS